MSLHLSKFKVPKKKRDLVGWVYMSIVLIVMVCWLNSFGFVAFQLIDVFIKGFVKVDRVDTTIQGILFALLLIVNYKVMYGITGEMIPMYHKHFQKSYIFFVFTHTLIIFFGAACLLYLFLNRKENSYDINFTQIIIPAVTICLAINVRAYSNFRNGLVNGK